MVALRRIPDQLPPPAPDGLITHPVNPHSYEKAYYWGGIVNAAARAMKGKWSGRRACIDLFASCGVNEDRKNSVLSWGSAMIALHADDPFDYYIFSDINPVATAALAHRAADLFGGAGFAVFALDLGSETLGAEVEKGRRATAEGPKVFVVTGDANDMPPIVRMILPGWPGQRYILSMIDPFNACFTWDALGKLTVDERMDLTMLFPEDMDIERALHSYLNQRLGDSKLDRYFGTAEWRTIASNPAITNKGVALRDLYKRRLGSELKYIEIAHRDRAIRNSIGVEIYKLIFASKHHRGRELWESANKTDPFGQTELYLPGI